MLYVIASRYFSWSVWNHFSVGHLIILGMPIEKQRASIIKVSRFKQDSFTSGRG